ncbi:helix-turn-helix transcriptional regulator [Sodalis sp. dw_96]|uniref:helix-turn-helix transcriptional regulator n=1 Tax=Sodalis sp. dw_96 TaxID=2719794 RepID=UPI001BD49C72|nr:helix-turn-helix transcriptional regulator [Sodalis sp. dw_96]
MNELDISTRRLSEKRRTLGHFLRTRREALTPEKAGLPFGSRRRTPGLRREEVALLANVGITWYTWLEQGRDVRASEDVLDAIADALRLDETERRHLFILSGRSASLPRLMDQKVNPSLQRMLDSLDGQPAYLTGYRWDILAWNHAAVAVFGDYAAMKSAERNLMYQLFASRQHRRLLCDWEALARTALGVFRNESAEYADDDGFGELIDKLINISEEFRLWWPEHRVLSNSTNIKNIDHPTQGKMAFEFTTFALTDGSAQKLTVFTPTDEYDSNSKLKILLLKYVK